MATRIKQQGQERKERTTEWDSQKRTARIGQEE
jgi:hypothetical protein